MMMMNLRLSQNCRCIDQGGRIMKDTRRLDVIECVVDDYIDEDHDYDDDEFEVGAVELWMH